MKRAWMLFTALAAFAVLLPAQLKMPAYKRTTLPNGVTVLTLVKKDVPLVTLRVLIKGGVESDTSQKTGLVDVTNDLLLRGTKSRSAEQIALDVDFLGASLGTESGDSANAIELEVLSKDVNEGVGILADLVLNPTFPEDEVAEELARAIDTAKARKDRPQAAIGAYASKFFYAGTQHPGGIVADEETLKRITRDDIVAYHRQQYVGSNLIVIAVGDMDGAAMEAELAKAFGAAPKGQPYAWKKVSAMQRPAQARLLLVDDADSTQTFFRIMQPGIARTSPDRVPMLLVNTLFGGRFTSMLNDALRVNAGLTYGASSILSQDRLPGELTIATFTATATTEKAVDMALDVLNTLRTKGVSAEQLASAKAYIKGTAPTSLIETNDQLADILGNFAINGLTEAEINELFARIDAVTPEDAKRVIDTYYRADGLTFVLMGQRSAIEKAAGKYAPNLVHASLADPGISVGPGR
jgi:predicted Zn-dependent peptidase